MVMEGVVVDYVQHDINDDDDDTGAKDVAQLMGFTAFGDKKQQLRQLKKELVLKQGLEGTKRGKTYVIIYTWMNNVYVNMCIKGFICS